MRSQLTRSVFRQLLSSDGLVFYCPSSSLASHQGRVRHAARQYARPPIRRSFWGFSQKPARQPKEPSVDPGLGKMSEVTQKRRVGARMPPRQEVIKAWRSFFSNRVKTGEAVNRLQAQHIMDTFRSLTETDDTETSRDTMRLTLDDLRQALTVLQRIPKDRTDLHNELARLVYAELSQMDTSIWRDTLRYVGILSQTGNAIEARDIALESCKKRAEQEAIENSNSDFRYVDFKIWKSVLRGFEKEKNPEELIRTLELGEKYGLQYDRRVHNIITTYFAQENDVQATKTWYSKPIVAAAGRDSTPTAQCLETILYFCIRNHELEWCTSIFKDVLSSNPDKEAWDVVLQWAAGTMGKGVEDLEEMMEVMVRRNADDETMKPDAATINGLVRLAMLLNDSYLAERYIALGQKWGIKPNAQTYVLQMNYRIEANDLRGAQSAYEALQAEEILNDADLPATNNYIRALCAVKVPNYDLITSITTDLEERGKRLEADTVTSLSLMHLHREEIDDVIDVLQTQVWHYSNDERARIRDAFAAYCLDGYNSTTKAWSAYTIFRQIFGETDIVIRTQMMNEFFRRRRSDMACHAFGHMRQHDNPLRRPVVQTYIECFEGIAKCKDNEHLDMVHNMLKLDSSIEPNTKLYNALMLAYTACDKPDRALHFWTDITTSLEGPSYNSLDIVFWACIRSPFGEVKAREIWAKMRRMQVEVTKEVFASYLGTIASAGLWEEAREMVDGMGKEFGFKMDLHILASLYNTLAGQERRDVCEKWAQEHHPQVWAELRKLGRVKLGRVKSFNYKIVRRA